MGSCAAPSAKGDDKFITTDYLQQCPSTEFLKWRPDCGYTGRTVLVSALRESQLPSEERVGSS
ncbi:replication initiator protein [Escherichia coli]|nr:replication initiator protein [Escherichia coli]